MRMPRAAGEADPGRAVGEAAAFRAAGEPAVLLRPTLAHLADPYKCRCASLSCRPLTDAHPSNASVPVHSSDSRHDVAAAAEPYAAGAGEHAAGSNM